MSGDDEWVKHVLDELVPMVAESACTMSIVPDTELDVKFAVELGISIMLDKPLILVVFPGRIIPDHLRRAADEIVEFDIDNPESTQRRVNEAMGRVLNL